MTLEERIAALAGSVAAHFNGLPRASHSIQVFGPIESGSVIYGRAISAFTITGWQIMSANAASGSVELDIWVNNSGTPTVADSIVNSNYPSISGSTTASGGVTGWTSVSISAGSRFAVRVRSLSGITALSFAAIGA